MGLFFFFFACLFIMVFSFLLLFLLICNISDAIQYIQYMYFQILSIIGCYKILNIFPGFFFICLGFGGVLGCAGSLLQWMDSGAHGLWDLSSRTRD